MTAELLLQAPAPFPRPQSLEDWRARLDRDRIEPIVAVAGSRGKTSVIRAVESILRVGGYRYAAWTDRGVEIDGRIQSGELGPWNRVRTSLAVGGLDVALQEVDWATVQTFGAAGLTAPVFAVANLCANSEACLVTPETMQARRALERIRRGVAAPGRLVLNADDFIVSAEERGDVADRYLFGISPETPLLRRHIERGGDACWVTGSSIVIHEDRTSRPFVDLRWLRWTRAGTVPFAVQTALTATAIARSCGLADAVIAAGLAAHEARPETMPGSFNVIPFGAATVVIDRPVPSWFLRGILRAAGPLGTGRQLRVVGVMREAPTEDLVEVGRLLGRGGGVLVLHGDWSDERLNALRHGAAINDVPPIILQAVDERAAIQQALGMVRPDDVMLVLAEDPPAVVRLIVRRARRRSARPPAAGTA